MAKQNKYNPKANGLKSKLAISLLLQLLFKQVKEAKVKKVVSLVFEETVTGIVNKNHKWSLILNLFYRFF